VIQRAKQVMGQIEKHSKIAIGLRQSNSSTKAVQERSSNTYLDVSDPASEQLTIFGS
jgi:DNA mismatch repair protein MutS